MKWQKSILTIKNLIMTEKVNRTIVFDFSKMSVEDIKKARDLFGGILSELPDEMFEKRHKELTAKDVIKVLMDTMDVSLENLRVILDKAAAVSNGAVYSIILRAIAVEMDKNYHNHIYDADEIYLFSLLDGKFHKEYTQNISKKSFKYFAAFRTQEDAIKAIKLTQAVRHELFE